MSTIESAPVSMSQRSAALLIGSFALLMLGLQPILLGELVDRKLISLEGVGPIAMGEILALGIGAGLADIFFPLRHYRLIAVLTVLGAAILDITTFWADGDLSFMILRAAAGLVEGMMLWVATATIVRSPKPETLTAIFTVTQTLSQAAIGWVLVALVMATWGWRGGFVCLAALSLACLVAIPWLPVALPPLQQGAQTFRTFKWAPSHILPLLIAFLQFSACASLMVYSDNLGQMVGLDEQQAKFVVAEILFTQALGGFAAIWLVRRLRAVTVLGFGGFGIAVLSAYIFSLTPGNQLEYIAACAVFGFVWLFLMPHHVALAFEVDGTGRVAMLVPVAQLVGSAIGPLVASLVVEGTEAGAVPLVCFGFAGLSAGIVVIGFVLRRRRLAVLPGARGEAC